MPIVVTQPGSGILCLTYRPSLPWLLVRISAVIGIAIWLSLSAKAMLWPAYLFSIVVIVAWMASWVSVVVEVDRGSRRLRERKKAPITLLAPRPGVDFGFDEIDAIGAKTVITRRKDLYLIEVKLRTGESVYLSIPFLGIGSCQEYATQIAEAVGVPQSQPAGVPA